MIDSVEDRCLQCRYSLKGLPPPHVCPECGLAYDAETVVFRRSFSITHFSEYIAVFALTGVVPITFLCFVRYGLAFCLTANGALGVCVFAYHWYHVRTVGPPFAALTKVGVVARARRGAARHMTYEKIGYITNGPTPYLRAKRMADDGSTVYEVQPNIHLDGIFDDEQEMHDFIRFVNRRIGVKETPV